MDLLAYWHDSTNKPRGSSSSTCTTVAGSVRPGTSWQIERIAYPRKRRDLDHSSKPHGTVVNGIPIGIQRTDLHVGDSQSHFSPHASTYLYTTHAQPKLV